MANRFNNPSIQFLDTNGDPLAGGLVHFYVTGTTTETDTYSEETLTTANANPVVLDGDGRAGDIFLDPNVTYKVVLADSTDATIWTADPVVDPAANVTAAIQVVSGDPNGQLAGNQGAVGGSAASVAWDITNALLYVCTTTGTASTAVWTQIGATLTGVPVFATDLTPSTIAADQDDYAPTGIGSASRIRLAASAAVQITGIQAATSDGSRMVLENIGSNNITLMSEHASSSAANRMSLPRPFVLRPSQSLEIEYDGTSSRWRPVAPIISQPIAGGALGLVVQVTGDAGVDIDATAITLEDANGEAYRAKSVNLSVDISSTGANGLDTGSAANSTGYFAFVIYNPTTDTVAGLVSTSATSPTLPSGYTFFRRVGGLFTDATADLIPTLQKGCRAQYVVNGSTLTAPLIMASGTAGDEAVPTWSAVAIGGYVPSTAVAIKAMVRGEVPDNGIQGVIVAPNNNYGAIDDDANPPPLAFGVTTASADTALKTFSIMGEIVLESTNIYWASGDANGALVCLGWVDDI